MLEMEHRQNPACAAVTDYTVMVNNEEISRCFLLLIMPRFLLYYCHHIQVVAFVVQPEVSGTANKNFRMMSYVSI